MRHYKAETFITFLNQWNVVRKTFFLQVETIWKSLETNGVLHTETVILNYCCLVAVMKIFVQLMLHFHWLSIPWWWTDIFGHSPSSTKMAALFVNVGQCEKRNIGFWRYCNNDIVKEAIAKCPSFFLPSTLLYLYLVTIQTI